MNSKLIAVIMAVAMATVGFTVMAVDDVDAADDTKQVYVQEGNTDSTIALGINEGNYTQYDYKLTWTMQISGQQSGQVIATIEKGKEYTATDYKVDEDDIGDSVTSPVFTISLEKNKNTGIYIVNIEGNAAADNPIKFTLDPKIVLTIDGVEKTIVYDSYIIEVTVAENSSGEIEIGLDNNDMAVGKYFEGKITSDIGIVISNYDWYAVGLPTGLTMSSNGTVSGIPTEEVEVTKSFTVFATDSAGTVLHGSIDYTVGPRVTGPNSFEYKVGTDKDNLKYNTDKTYVFAANEKIILSVTNVVEEGGSAINSGVEVSLILTTNGTTDVICLGDDDNINGQFTLRDGSNTKESGAFIVTINYNGETEQFRIYIVGQAAVIGPEIFIIGS